MNSYLSFATFVGVLVMALVLVATPVLADSQTTTDGSYVKVAGGKSLIYGSYTSAFPSYTINSLTKPFYSGTITSGRPSLNTIFNARYMPGDDSYSALPGAAFSLPGPKYGWDDYFTQPSPCGCGCV